MIADRLHAVLSAPHTLKVPEPKTPAADLTGVWDVHIEFAASIVNILYRFISRARRYRGSTVIAKLAALVPAPKAHLVRY